MIRKNGQNNEQFYLFELIIRLLKKIFILPF